MRRKEKVQRKRLQTDRNFEQKKMFDLNKQYNVDMCSSVVRGGKVFTTDQKLRELKKRIFRLKALKNKIKSKRLTPYEIMKKPVENMISMPSVKY